MSNVKAKASPTPASIAPASAPATVSTAPAAAAPVAKAEHVKRAAEMVVLKVRGATKRDVAARAANGYITIEPGFFNAYAKGVSNELRDAARVVAAQYELPVEVGTALPMSAMMCVLVDKRATFDLGYLAGSFIAGTRDHASAKGKNKQDAALFSLGARAFAPK